MKRIVITAMLFPLPTVAVFASDDDAELQKKLANPVADLITVPFQLNANFNTGPLDKTQHTLNVQPVYPAKLEGRWSLINRAIIPLLDAPPTTAGQDREYGLGDILYQGFLSPESKGIIWGIGPALQFDSATDDRLGSGKWAAGPTAVALLQNGPWSYGALATQLWSFAGDDNRPDVSLLQLQPIISYTLSPQHSIAYSGIITANWEEKRDSQRWTVPIGLTYSILTRPTWTKNPVNLVMGGGYNVIRPDEAADWTIKFQVNFIFNK